MKKANIYPWIFAVIFLVIGIPIGLIVFNFIMLDIFGDTSAKDLELFIGGGIAVGIIIDFIIAGHRIGESISNRVEITKKYEDKIKQWEAEGYNVEKLKRKWGFE